MLTVSPSALATREVEQTVPVEVSCEQGSRPSPHAERLARRESTEAVSLEERHVVVEHACYGQILSSVRVEISRDHCLRSDGYRDLPSQGSSTETIAQEHDHPVVRRVGHGQVGQPVVVEIGNGECRSARRQVGGQCKATRPVTQEHPQRPICAAYGKQVDQAVAIEIASGEVVRRDPQLLLPGRDQSPSAVAQPDAQTCSHCGHVLQSIVVQIEHDYRGRVGIHRKIVAEEPSCSVSDQDADRPVVSIGCREIHDAIRIQVPGGERRGTAAYGKRRVELKAARPISQQEAHCAVRRTGSGEIDGSIAVEIAGGEAADRYSCTEIDRVGQGLTAKEQIDATCRGPGHGQIGGSVSIEVTCCDRRGAPVYGHVYRASEVAKAIAQQQGDRVVSEVGHDQVDRAIGVKIANADILWCDTDLETARGRSKHLGCGAGDRHAAEQQEHARRPPRYRDRSLRTAGTMAPIRRFHGTPVQPEDLIRCVLGDTTPRALT